MAALTTDTYLVLRMRLLRQARGLSLRALDKQLGVSDQAILNLELGRTSCMCAICWPLRRCWTAIRSQCWPISAPACR
jgi:hypothetical protein